MNVFRVKFVLLCVYLIPWQIFKAKYEPESCNSKWYHVVVVTPTVDNVLWMIFTFRKKTHHGSFGLFLEAGDD